MQELASGITGRSMQVASDTDMSGEMATELYLDLLKKCLTASIYDESSWWVVGRERIDALKHPPSKWDVIQLARAWTQRFVIGQLRKRSLLLVRQARFSLEAREGGVDWPCFGYTMTGHRRLEVLKSCIQDVLARQVPGDFIETGCWRGGTTIFMRAVLRAYGVTDRTVWVADSFEGMPRPDGLRDGWDFSSVEYLRVSLDQVRASFDRFGLLDDKVRFLPGWFKDTLPSAPIQKLSILRLDGDLYHSTMDALKNLYFKASPGAYVIVDDYYGWEGCRRAVDEFLCENRIQTRIERIDSGSVYWRVPE